MSATESSRGSKGRSYYAAVKVLIDQGMKSKDAIEKVAGSNGETAANVSTAYYRINRSEGGGSSRARSAGSSKSYPLPEKLAGLVDDVRQAQRALSAAESKMLDGFASYASGADDLKKRERALESDNSLSELFAVIEKLKKGD